MATTTKVVVQSAKHVRKEVEDGSVDLVLFGPPYWREYSYSKDVGQVGRISSYSSYLTTMRSHFAELAKVLKPEGGFFFLVS